jgi:hypothetical protein
MSLDPYRYHEVFALPIPDGGTPVLPVSPLTPVFEILRQTAGGPAVSCRDLPDAEGLYRRRGREEYLAFG